MPEFMTSLRNFITTVFQGLIEIVIGLFGGSAE